MYSSHHYQYLVSCVLLGDKLALDELIKRHRENHSLLNPKNSHGTPLLQALIKDGKTYSATFLLDNLDDKTEVNKQDKFGDTPLHEAAKNGNKTLVERLLEKGASPFTKNFNKVTAGMLAKRSGHKEIAYRLRASFISNYSSLFFSSNGSFQKNEDQNKPLDLSKTGPYATKVIRPEESEEIVVEIDPRDILFNYGA
ncbi:MAG: ankyrin repeat domain-containing protein [Pseudomonadota bacterium]